MKPENVEKTPHLGSIRHAPPGRPAADLSPQNLDELDALTSASETFQRTDRPTAPPRRGSWPIALVCAALVGGAVTWVEGFQYECTAVIAHRNPSPAGGGEKLQARFREHLARRVADETTDGFVPDAWHVETLATGGLRLAVRTSDKAGGRAFVEEVATGFVQDLSESRAAARLRPDEAEQVVSAYVQRLQQRLANFNEHAARAEASTPGSDPRPERQQRLDQWQSQSAQYKEIHTTLRSAAETLRRLEAAPPPNHGVVTAEQRRRAVEADEALVQDLAELEVQLGEVKVSVLSVAQEVAERLAALTAAAHALAAALPEKQSDGQSNSEAPALPWGDLPALVEEYDQAIVGFEGAFVPWSVKLRRWTCDPRSARVLDMHQEASSMLAAFMHRSAHLLATMRERLQSAGGEISDTARHHVLHSNLVRSLAKLRRAHDRFGFAADQIKPTLNFHIDAPLRSARGLRKRSRLRIEHIERGLERQARTAARKAHSDRIERTRQLLQATRGEIDENVADILDLQNELNLSAETSEAFLKAVLQHQFAKNLAQAAQDDMLEMKTRLDHLRAKRAEKWAHFDLQVSPATITASPINLYPRLKTGTLAAFATLLAVGLVQWWAGRR